MKTRLTQSYVDRFRTLKSKENLIDTELTGFLCEVAASGRKTFYVMFTDEFGRQRQKKVGDGSILSVKEAREQARTLLRQIQTEGPASLSNPTGLRDCPTFAEFVRSRYLPHAKATKRSWDTDESLLRNHLVPAFGKQRLAEIRIEDIEAYYHADLVRGAARGSANRRVILLRYLFNLAIKWEVPGVQKNPARLVQLADPQNARERFLNAAEMQRLQQTVEASPNRMLRFIIPALLLTGMRKREVLDARWEDIDLEARTWYLPVTKSGKPRVVQLSDALQQLLQSVPRRAACPWVFANPVTGKPFLSIFYAWDTARTKAGVAEVRLHDLRHTFASLLINGNYDLYDVMHALGHTQMRTTMRYAHLSRERKQAAVNAVALQSGLLAVLPVGEAANPTPFEKVA